MPTYTYQCTKCDHLMHVFHSMTASPKVTCEACNSKKVRRLIGTGAGLIFKGSGFYETDYKKNGGKVGTGDNGSKAKADGKSEATPPKPESKSTSPSNSSSKLSSAD